jgi:mono/diheme cytochrome c family protein
MNTNGNPPDPDARPTAGSNNRNTSRKGFWRGMITMLILVIVVPLLVAALGIVNVSAQGSWGPLDPLLDFASSRSIAFHGKDQTNPYANDPEAIETGMHHYKEMCVVCHSAPGLDKSEIAEGLNPGAPNLASPDSQEMTDGQIFWIIANGVRSTGMPAFEEADDVETRWKIVAFVRHLPHITDAERRFLAPAEEEEGGEHAAVEESEAPDDSKD